MQCLFWAAPDIHSTSSGKGLESIGLYHWKLVTLLTTQLTTTWIHKWLWIFPSGWADSSSLIVHAYGITSYWCFSCPGKNFKTLLLHFKLRNILLFLLMFDWRSALFSKVEHERCDYVGVGLIISKFNGCSTKISWVLEVL